MTTVNAPKVFISYSWDDDSHTKWVQDMASRMRADDGIDVILDRWQKVGTKLPMFMEKSVQDSDFVLVICTPKYKKKSDNREGGVGYEGNIITSEILEGSKQQKFIPILRRGDWKDALPIWLKGTKGLDFKSDPVQEEIYRELIQTLYKQIELSPRLGKPSIRVDPEIEANKKKLDSNEIDSFVMQYGSFEDRILLVLYQRMRQYQGDPDVSFGTLSQKIGLPHKDRDELIVKYLMRLKEMRFIDYAATATGKFGLVRLTPNGQRVVEDIFESVLREQ